MAPIPVEAWTHRRSAWMVLDLPIHARFALKMPSRRAVRKKYKLVLPLTAATLVAAGTVAMTGSASAASVFSDDYEDGNSTGWSKSGGTWSVVTDGSRVLQQSNASSSNARQFAGEVSWTDYTVQARIKPLTLGAGGFAALLGRVSGSTTFYRLALLSGNQVQLQLVKGSAVTVLASASHTVTAGNWYSVALTASGSAVTGTIDGVAIGTASSSLSASGRIGLQTGAGSASFDDVTVSTQGSSAPTTTVSPTAPTSSASTVSPSASPSVTSAPAGSLFVANNGSDSNPGTEGQPLLTIQKAVDLVLPGGAIMVRGGTYALTKNIQITKSGSSGKTITLSRYGSERVVIDGEGLPNTPAPVGGSIDRVDRGAIHMEASFWKLYGLEIINGPYALYCDGCNNNTFELLATHDNYESGVQIQGESGNNLVLNLDSYMNRDPRKNGESADGLAIKQGGGTGNVVRGARLWNNVDDGLDFYQFTSPITVENSISYGNGVNRWNFPDFAGDGNGFKLGGGPDGTDPAANHIIRNNMAFNNQHHGFADNGNPGSLTITNCTAYNNPVTGFDFDESTSKLTANLAVTNGTAATLGSSTGSGNSWDLSSVPALASTDASIITGPRAADGSIPTSTFLRPTSGANIGARI